MNGKDPFRVSAVDKTANAGDYAVLRPGGAYRMEAVAFMRERLGDERFNRIMASRESFLKYPYVAAKLYLSVEDWNKYVWIEWHGSLEGYARFAGQESRPAGKR